MEAEERITEGRSVGCGEEDEATAMDLGTRNIIRKLDWRNVNDISVTLRPWSRSVLRRSARTGGPRIGGQ